MFRVLCINEVVASPFFGMTRSTDGVVISVGTNAGFWAGLNV